MKKDEETAPMAAPVAPKTVRCRGCGNKWYGDNPVCPACGQTDPKEVPA